VFCTDWDDVVDARDATLIATQDVDVLGRCSYDEWAEFWPGSDIKPFAILNGSQSTSTPPRRSIASTPKRPWWTVTWSKLCETYRIGRGATSASTPASRSSRHCSQQAWSTSSGSRSRR
jgi:hypothetical protein